MIATHVATPLGAVLLAATEEGLAGLWFEGQRHHPDASPWTMLPLEGQHAADQGAQGLALQWLQETARELRAYFAGDHVPAGHRFRTPLAAAWGTPFQRAVWHALSAIPLGSTTSYTALAQRIGRPTAVRAVGAAVGRNPWSIIVPCHRVLGSGSQLTGYAGGLERKRALLQREGAQSPKS